MAMTRDDLRFQRIYEDHHDRIFRYLTRMAGERDAEDLTQDVFIKVGLSLEGYRGDSNLNTWIYRIATNAALDWFRRASARGGNSGSVPDNSSDEDGEYRDEGFALETSGGEQRVIRQEMNGCIRSIIGGLPESYRSVIILSELEEMRDNEIAEILGISLQAAKIRLHRARARLRRELKKACVLYHDERNELACDLKPTGGDL